MRRRTLIARLHHHVTILCRKIALVPKLQDDDCEGQAQVRSPLHIRNVG